MRYFLTLAYDGTHYGGWQSQPNAPSVQETLEKALSTILGEQISVTGCGRTDAGVHARYYVAHFDAEKTLPGSFIKGLNSILPADIAVYEARPTASDAHARFDAVERSYIYYIRTVKDPFSRETAWFYPQFDKLDWPAMCAVAELIRQYGDFSPFCKTRSGVDTYACRIHAAFWQKSEDHRTLSFHISANRFLRGMVRLIVGASITVGKGQMSLEAVKNALETQTPLPKSLSAPAHGLFLTDVQYPVQQISFPVHHS